MGMSTFVTGFKPPDEKWRRMKAIYDACHAAEIAPPQEVSDFFNWQKPTDTGVRIDGCVLEACGAVRQIHDGHPESGYEIVIEKLPKDVTVVRVENCW